MSRKPPVILLVDWGKLPGNIKQGYEINIIYDWLKYIDKKLKVVFFTGKDLHDTPVTDIVGLYPQTWTNTNKLVKKLSLTKISYIILQPHKQDKSSCIYAESSSNSTSYYLGTSVLKSWLPHMRRQDGHVTFLPLPYPDEDITPRASKFKDRVRFITDFTTDNSETKKAIGAFFRLVSAVKCEDREKEIIILVDNWIDWKPDQEIIKDLVIQWRQVKFANKEQVQRYFEDAIWVFLHKVEYISGVRMQPAIHGIPHVFHTDTSLIQTIGEIPEEFQQIMTWDGNQEEELHSKVQRMVDNPAEAVRAARRYSDWLQGSSEMHNMRMAVYENCLHGRLRHLKTEIMRRDSNGDFQVVPGETFKFLHYLMMCVGRTSRRSGREAQRSNKMRETDRERSTRILNSRLPAKAITVTEGSIILQLYVPRQVMDKEMDFWLHENITNGSMAQVFIDVMLNAWKIIFPTPETPDASEYAMKTSLIQGRETVREKIVTVTTTDDIGNSILHRAAEADASSVVRQRLEKGDKVYIVNREGKTPLHIASENGHSEVCIFLLESGASLIAKDWEGKTPLHLASENGDNDVCKILLERGAPLNAEDKAKRTPLHYSAGHGYISVNELLLRNGASVEMQDKDGKTPDQLAPHGILTEEQRRAEEKISLKEAIQKGAPYVEEYHTLMQKWFKARQNLIKDLENISDGIDKFNRITNKAFNVSSGVGFASIALGLGSFIFPILAPAAGIAATGGMVGGATAAGSAFMDAGYRHIMMQQAESKIKEEKKLYHEIERKVEEIRYIAEQYKPRLLNMDLAQVKSVIFLGQTAVQYGIDLLTYTSILSDFIHPSGADGAGASITPVIRVPAIIVTFAVAVIIDKIFQSVKQLKGNLEAASQGLRNVISDLNEDYMEMKYQYKDFEMELKESTDKIISMVAEQRTDI